MRPPQVVRDARRRPLHTPCAHAGWMMRPGLDGQPDTVSFEAADKPGYYITAYVSHILHVVVGGHAGEFHRRADHLY